MDAKCVIELGTSFVLAVEPSTIPNGGYSGWTTQLFYGDLLYKPGILVTSGERQGRNSQEPDENQWDLAFLPVRAPASPDGKEGIVAHGDVSAFLPPFPASSQKTLFLELDFNCSKNGGTPGQSFSQKVTLIPFDAVTNPGGTNYLLADGVTATTPNLPNITINCEPATPTPVPPTATDTPIPPTSTNTPSSPSVNKCAKKVFDPSSSDGCAELVNLFLTAQGNKLPPDTCKSGTDGVTFDQSINTKVTGEDKHGDPRDLGGFSFKVNFDETKVCVFIELGELAQAWVAAGGTCVITDTKTNPTLQGSATVFCVSLGKQSYSPTDNLTLARVTVKPMPDEYSVMKPNNSNGNVVQIINKSCKLTDQQGDPIAAPAGQPNCTDADVTIRYLEGDVVPDCKVDTIDTQAEAFRWGSQKGTLLYNDFNNLEPSKPKQDDDIDINDLQFVYGRFGSGCNNQFQQPLQPPINPKAV